MTNIELAKDECKKRFRKTLEQYPPEFRDVELRFSSRMTRALGYYEYFNNGGTSFITISIPYLEEQPEYTLNFTLLHELAHHIAHVKHPHKKVGHGIEWKQEFSALSGVPVNEIRAMTKGHRLSEKYIAKNRIAYTCGCTTHYMTKRAHNNILNGAKYKCTLCGERLKLKEEA